MATGVRSWLGLVLVGMAAIVVRVLPIESERPANDEVSPQLAHFGSLLEDIRFEQEHLRRLSWLDSMTAALDASTEPTSVALLMPEGTDADSVEAFERRLQKELGQLGVRSADFGVLLTAPPKLDQISPSNVPWEHEHDEYYVGSRGGRPYCFVVRLAKDPLVGLIRGGWGGSTFLGPESILGPCGYVLRYGLPGPVISRWLKAGSFSRGMHPPRSPGYGLLRRRPEPDARWREEMAGGSLAGQSCIRTELSSCSAIFLDPKDAEESVPSQLAEAVPELWEVTGVHTHHLQFIESQMLAELEAEFGRDRFARFWSSDRPVPQAFEEAFGVAPGTWLQGWARGFYSSGSARSDRVEAVAIATMVLLGACASVLRSARRRSVA